MGALRDKEELRKWVKAELERKRSEAEEQHKRTWENLPKFEKPEDVPEIPRVDADTYKNYYVPKLITAGAIPKKDLVDGQVYIGEHRRCTVAKWDAKENHFKYLRHKFNNVFWDNCNHFEDDNGFALFVPIKLGAEEDLKH